MENALSFGEALSFYIKVNQTSQFSLSVEAEVSAKHISQLVNNAKKPSIPMIDRLARALSLSPKETNTLYVSAGFNASKLVHSDQSVIMNRVDIAIKSLLKASLPYPTLVISTSGKLYGMNKAAKKMLALLLDGSEVNKGDNIYEYFLNHESFKKILKNWDEVMFNIFHHLQHEAVIPSSQTAQLKILIEKFSDTLNLSDESYQDMKTHDFLPTLSYKIKKGPLKLSVFSISSSFGSMIDPELRDLRIEYVFPEDKITKLFFNTLK